MTGAARIAAAWSGRIGFPGDCDLARRVARARGAGPAVEDAR
ncbi:hypothetical protein [Amaricoccus sp.]|nr:hypothetical protein [Amaricoccus sp.]